MTRVSGFWIDELAFDETVQPLRWNGLRVEIDHLESGIPFLVIGDKVHEITMGGADAATLRDWLNKAVTRAQS